MTELELRTHFVDTARAFYGAQRGDNRHKEILAVYNSQSVLPRGYRVKETDAWCATFVSAIAIKCGLTDIIPTECSCDQMIRLHKEKGTWVESDAHVPRPGDLILYDWDDSGKGDNTGSPDHIGIVVRITDGVIRVIEGNLSNAVWHRDIKVDGKTIRGYCVPEFTAMADRKVELMGKFKDVSDGKYYTEAVEKAAELGLMNGVAEDKFGVGEPVTREQLATVMVRLYEILKR